jgi:hypothetical protein
LAQVKKFGGNSLEKALKEAQKYLERPDLVELENEFSWENVQGFDFTARHVD